MKTLNSTSREHSNIDVWRNFAELAGIIFVFCDLLFGVVFEQGSVYFLFVPCLCFWWWSSTQSIPPEKKHVLGRGLLLFLGTVLAAFLTRNSVSTDLCFPVVGLAYSLALSPALAATFTSLAAASWLLQAYLIDKFSLHNIADSSFVIVLGVLLSRGVATLSKQKQRLKIASRENDRLTAMYQQLNSMLLMFEADGKLVYQNDVLHKLPENFELEPTIRSLLRAVHPEDRAEAISNYKLVIDGRSDSDVSMVIRFANRLDKHIWMEIRYTNRLKHPHIAALIISATDVSSRVADEKIILEERNLLSTVIDALPQSVSIKGVDGRYLRVNKAFLEFNGISDAADIAGKKPTDIDAGEQGQQFEEEDLEVMQEGHTVIYDRQVTRPSQSPAERWVEVTRVPLRHVEDSVFGMVSIARDITDERNTHMRLIWQASHDALTGLPNRRALMDKLQTMYEQGSPYTLLYLDLDFFKTINDQFGHDVGDQLLIQMSQRISNQLRSRDILARLGGDEFVVFRRGEDSAIEAGIAADQLIAALHEPVIIGGNRLKVECSLGIARSRGSEVLPKDMLRNADMAMYTAKDKGRNQTAFFDDALRDKAQRQAALAQALQFAMDQDELSVVYQPKFRLSDQKLVGMEALLRWHSQQYGNVSPGEFIPIAEQSSLIRHMGRWVMAQACRQMAQWQREFDGMDDVHIAVNVSTKQLLIDEFVDEVTNTLGSTGLDPKSLELEVTESAVMLNPIQARMTLVRLKAQGVRVALDDFGTGYSSLAYVRLLPLDVIKIDRSFVTGLELDKGDKEIIRTILAFADTRELETVAEGIESERVASELRAMGCQIGQGYLFSKPLTATAMKHLLSESHSASRPVQVA